MKNTELKLCRKCKQYKFAFQFLRKRSSHICNSCYPEYERQRQRNRRRNRRAKKTGVIQSFTLRHERIVYKAYGNKCFFCGSSHNLTIDHYKPLSKGNPLSVENAVLLCKKCNVKKDNKDPEKFFGEKGCAIIEAINITSLIIHDIQ